MNRLHIFKVEPVLGSIRPLVNAWILTQNECKALISIGIT